MPKTLHVLFVGINAYPKIPLKGCINDVLDMYDFLRMLSEANADIAKFRPKFLLAPSKDEVLSLQKADIEFSPATRKNIVAGFEHFAAAKADDICLFYFSGHGSFQTAPRQFRHQKSAPQVETLVAVDSRMYGGRDLVDKELGYLIWKTVQNKPNLHFVAIADCCHSGDNTRDTNSEITAREAHPQRMIPLKSYVGLEQILSKKRANIPAYYQVSKDLQRIDNQSGTHIHLAAARENETAKEMTLNGKRRGVFTYHLLKTLRNGGLQASYAQLVEEVGMRIKAKVSHQMPVAAAFGAADLGDTFFKQQLRAPRAEYLVFYDENEASWKVKAGQINGIPAADLGTNIVTIYQATTGKKVGAVEVEEVGVSESYLADFGNSFSLSAQGRYYAVFTQLALPQLQLFLASNPLSDSQTKKLKSLLADSKYLSLTEDFATADYPILALDGDFILTKKSDQIPLFQRQSTPEDFVFCAEKVANWQNVLTLESPDHQSADSLIERSDIAIQVELIEGKPFTARNIERLPATQTLLNPTKISTQYQYVGDKYVQPAFRLTVKTKANYWIGGLYLTSKFGIEEYIVPQEIKPDENGAQFQFQAKGKFYKTLPLSFDKLYHQHHITEVENYLKIFVATEPFQLRNFKQKELPLDDHQEKDRSSIAFDQADLPAWRCITIPLRVHCPYDAQSIPQISFDGTATEEKLGDFKISCPAGFKATVTAASERQVERIFKQTQRSGTAADLAILNRSLLPPATLFGGATTAESPLQRSAYGNPAEQLSILEMDVTTDTLSTDNQLIITPSEKLAADEVVLPFGYDEQTDMYLPLGYTNAEGEICIDQLPPTSAGQIFNQKAINERSIGRSIKLFFKKVVLQETEQLQRLVIHKKSKRRIKARPVKKNELANKKAAHILLVIHGIIGSTEGQVAAALAKNGFGKNFDTVLSFDYENLNTPIEKTAEILENKLRTAGLFEQKQARLTMVAHSMGGLVARVFIEQLSGHQIVKQLVMCGTPNGGSETGDFRKSIFGMLTKALNGAAVLKPYLPILTFLGKQIGKRLFHTHNQMTPGSEFLADLMQPPKVPLPDYRLLAGDTSLIQPDVQMDDPFWSKWSKILLQRAKNEAIAYFIFSDKHNDIAVRVTQMKRSNGLATAQVIVVDCDHMSYFMHKKSLVALKKALI